MSAPLSVCVMACDDARTLEYCLRSVAWADEVIVVVDAKSGDASEEIARRIASYVEVRPYPGDVAQKRYCAGLAKHDWVLALDADEVVTSGLADSIRNVLASSSSAGELVGGVPGAPVGLRVNRATWHLGRWIEHGDFYPDWKLRLFRHSRARWAGRDPHGRVEVDGAVADLEGDLEHYSYRDLADQIARVQVFSQQAADALVDEGVPFRLSRLVLHPPARFLRSYVLRQGFRDGLPGFVIAAVSAYYVFLKYATHWERSRPSGGNGQGPR